ncbi:pyridine nucleotide-disulfide oxidoreductase [Synechococcus sp. BSF8S]|uniref:FAD-dependent oxidoreductase n=1 Tax=Synechococcales TaxID=1890424 RepID=UPI001627E022|nr:MULTISPECIES: bifunctional TVP38/TMEM64 family protein/FAD-dependent oxidoreductase [unclassified Synechococcus]MBC1260429.1 pyridine nucleotide-disulfide oxidoreductase [Synechococcus sp. BSF8S]MBC1263800.1 pyridine nucleotide-disulfide oxidoreductase [Synechococcus sp. BSA11S]
MTRNPLRRGPSGASSRRWLLLLAVVGLVALFFLLDLPGKLSLEALREAHGSLLAWRERAPFGAAALYGLAYVVVTGLSLPGAAVMTLAGGAIFGLGLGTLLVSFASSAGATIAFLLARTLLREPMLKRFGARLAPIEEGLRRDGVLYLLSLRLVPVFPFFLVNVVMGLTPIRTISFYLTSQLGMLPGTLVYVNAGTQLAQLRSLEGILTPPLLLSLALLGVFPWIARLALERWKVWRLYRPWTRPARFDRNLIVIGAGAAGLVTAYIAAAVKAKVTLIEAERMGGDCLNTGCVPSKALIATARQAARMRQADRYGLEPHEPQVSLQVVLERVFAKVAEVAPHDSVERYEGLGVEVLRGHGRLIDPWTVAITTRDGLEQRLTAPAIVLATGASPVLPDLPGAGAVGLLTSETVWQALRDCPLASPRIVVMGGGPIGCELSQAMARLGVRVTLLQRGPRLLSREDPDAAAVVRQALEADGVQVLTGCTVRGFELRPAAEGVAAATAVLIETDGPEGPEPTELLCDQVLCAIGRRARLEGYGLEELGIPTGRTIETNASLQTLFPNIYAAGDVAGPWQFTHTAAHQAWYAAVNALFGDFRRFRVDGRVIPRTTFTDPELASVGLSESEASRQGVAVEVTRFPLHELDRAIVESAETGFVKVLTAPGSDRLLGVTIVGEQAGELLAEFVLAMRWRLGLGKILSTIHAYPTFSEANKYAAGAWKRAHAPQRTLALLQRFHTWRRGH